VVDVLRCQIQFVLVVLTLSAVFPAAIGEKALPRDLVLLEEGQHTVVLDSSPFSPVIPDWYL
jgi:hypothetical protein